MKEKSSSRTWDILVVRDQGGWVGFKLSLKQLQKSATYFVVLLLLGSIMTFAWALMRFEVFRLREKLYSEELRAKSLEMQLESVKNATTLQSSEVSQNEELSFLPSLGDTKQSTSNFVLKDLNVDYEQKESEISVKYTLDKNASAPMQTQKDLFWAILLHGARGIWAFPDVLASQSGNMILHHRGEAIKDFRKERKILARFKASIPFVDSDPRPLMATLYLYDSLGTLLLKERIPVKVAGKNILDKTSVPMNGVPSER